MRLRATPSSTTSSAVIRKRLCGLEQTLAPDPVRLSSRRVSSLKWTDVLGNMSRATCRLKKPHPRHRVERDLQRDTNSVPWTIRVTPLTRTRSSMPTRIPFRKSPLSLLRCTRRPAFRFTLKRKSRITTMLSPRRIRIPFRLPRECQRVTTTSTVVQY